ncbi:hypothetical protein ACTHPH_20060 [Paenibacillus pasadenensis]|uniref:DUF2759 domain-containing protein n=1 Tax=Paenibacillus pasadenensis TaxID=217090 RepID=A0A2N5N170_9BACL|nr:MULTISPECIES: hypothetical protein [Paenibacillus]PLT44088.1 hypothetical protein B8V81_2519 [Paenibacillus pasadenensis]QGG54625.1 hypothetical protein GE073_02745 [Paenibacillus sp. B01]
MFLAAEELEATSSTFNTFDIFMVIFTILIALGLVRLVAQKKKNIFAIGWTAACLLVFLIVDFFMVKIWMGI